MPFSSDKYSIEPRVSILNKLRCASQADLGVEQNWVEQASKWLRTPQAHLIDPYLGFSVSDLLHWTPELRHLIKRFNMQTVRLAQNESQLGQRDSFSTAALQISLWSSFIVGTNCKLKGNAAVLHSIRVLYVLHSIVHLSIAFEGLQSLPGFLTGTGKIQRLFHKYQEGQRSKATENVQVWISWKCGQHAV